VPQRFTSAGFLNLSLLTQRNTGISASAMEINTETTIRNLHIDVLDTMLAILTNDVRERKALRVFWTVDDHMFPIHFHLSYFPECKEKEEYEEGYR
jgi:hypothetical protein